MCHIYGCIVQYLCIFLILYKRLRSHHVTAAAGKHPVPLKSLVDFSRVSVKRGATVTVTFELSEDAFALVDETGARVVVKGSRSVMFDLGDGAQPVEISVTI